jgi:CheY-like chemotaxis protein
MASQRYVLCGRPEAALAECGEISSDDCIPVVRRPASDGIGPKLGFLASLNHEIRTPLSGILGMTDLLLEYGLDAEARGYVEATRQCAEGLSELLNATLEYTSLTANCVQLDEAEFHVGEVLETAVAELQGRLASHRLEIMPKLDDSTRRTLIGDAYRIRQLARLLLDNAWRFASSGRIEFHAEVSESGGPAVELVLAARTNGGGIGAERFSEVYEGFLHLESGLHRKFSYSSLGLALLRRLVDLLCGDLTVESRPDYGYEFRAVLPLRLPRQRPVLVDRASGPAAGTGRRVLVVDDNRISRHVLSAVLGKGGFEHHCAASGYEALEAASETLFHLVLMDLRMPGLDGIETTLRLRQIPGYADVPVLALTAEVSDSVRSQCRRAGMQEFLNKPVVAAELLSTVRRRLAGNESLD